MASVKKYLKIAAKLSRSKDDERRFFLGAVALRNDDVLVYSYNGAPKFPDRKHHCEARLARKLDKGAVVYLARTTSDGEWADSRPCGACEKTLRTCGVRKVFYTIGPSEYGCISFE